MQENKFYIYSLRSKTRKLGENLEFFLEQLANDLVITKQEAKLIIQAVGRCAQVCLLEDRPFIVPDAFVVSTHKNGTYLTGGDPIRCVLCPQLRFLLNSRNMSKTDDKKVTSADPVPDSDEQATEEDQMF
jgi:hypothetical protein